MIMSIRKLSFGTPEKHVPSNFCPDFCTKVDICGKGNKNGNFDISAVTFRTTQRGCVVELPFSQDEEYYGFGLQLYSFSHKNRKLTLRVNSDPMFSTGDTHAPAPFFVSTAGYGIYADTARYAEFYMGVQRVSSETKQSRGASADNTESLYAPDRDTNEKVIAIHIPSAQGIDLYIIEGENILDVVKQYNMMSGAGPDIPDWGLRTYYRCHVDADAKSVINTVDYLCKSGLPVGVIGLEPHWQTRAYSCSYVWSDLFTPDMRSAMYERLRSEGLHLNLWQHAFVHPESPLYSMIADGCGDYKVWGGKVPDFACSSTRDVFSEYQSRELVNDVTDGFKLDECDGSDYTRDWSFPNCSLFPSGMDGEQYHCMFGTLYARTVMQALSGRKTFGQCRNAGALAASLPFALYSDLYGHREFIRGCVNSGFSGMLWAPEVRHAKSAEDLIRRLQTAVFSAQCMFNGWYCTEAPWVTFGCEDKVRELFALRESLVPMLRRAYDLYREDGTPPVRALVCDYTDDKRTWGIDDEYIFCGELIVAPMVEGEKSRKVYLPEGKWVDFFTNEPVDAGEFTYTEDNIPVYRKVG